MTIFRIIIIWLILLLIAGWFYWFEYRPSLIKSYCNDYAGDKAHDLLGTKVELYGKYKEAYEKGMFLKDDFNSIYEKCLHSKGL